LPIELSLRFMGPGAAHRLHPPLGACLRPKLGIN